MPNCAATKSIQVLTYQIKKHCPKGWMLGNPVIFCSTGGLESAGGLMLQFNRWFYNALIPYEIYHRWITPFKCKPHKCPFDDKKKKCCQNCKPGQADCMR